MATRPCPSVGPPRFESSTTGLSCTLLRARMPCNTAGSRVQAWKSSGPQKPAWKLPGSFGRVRHLNHSGARCSASPRWVRAFGTAACARCARELPPPPQIPYPSHTRPEDTHRRQAGRTSSHLTVRALWVHEGQWVQFSGKRRHRLRPTSRFCSPISPSSSTVDLDSWRKATPD
jgi:hypothetical protein